MAAVVTAQTVELAARDGCFDTGRALHAAGRVTDLECAYFGVGGFVAEGGEEFDVWVGIRRRMLVGECDCPDADPQASSEESLAALEAGRGDPAGLCPHAVAVALAAVERGLPWELAAAQHPGGEPTQALPRGGRRGRPGPAHAEQRASV